MRFRVWRTNRLAPPRPLALVLHVLRHRIAHCRAAPWRLAFKIPHGARWRPAPLCTLSLRLRIALQPPVLDLLRTSRGKPVKALFRLVLEVSRERGLVDGVPPGLGGVAPIWAIRGSASVEKQLRPLPRFPHTERRENCERTDDHQQTHSQASHLLLIVNQPTQDAVRAGFAINVGRRALEGHDGGNNER